MFSGIIENIGTVKEYKKLKDYLLVLDTDLNFKDVKKGSSVCCNGVCLTVTSKKKLSKKTRLSFDVSKETVNCTNFNDIRIGDLINIEKSLRVGDEISGHFVFGHVDDTASLASSIKIGGSYELKFKISKKLSKFIAKKGSVAINGISLTINNFKKGEICLNILKKDWSPILTIKKVLLGISALLTNPNPDDPLQSDVADIYIKNKKLYEQNVKEYVLAYDKTKSILNNSKPKKVIVVPGKIINIVL